MRRLIYASRWAPEVRDDVRHVLQNIVARSIANNRLCDVTGFLLCHDGVFVQALEGPRASVEETFQRISGDRRHSGVTVLADDVPPARVFRGWNMAGAHCWNEAIGAEIDAAAADGFTGLPGERWLSILQTVAAVDMGRVPCTVAA